MALIKCPECGHDISTYSDRCIYCGCPMDVIKKLLDEKEKESSEIKVTPAIGKYLGSLSKDDYEFISDFTSELNSKYKDLFSTKENNKSFAYKFHKYPRLLLQFKTVQASGALKLEYRTTGVKRRLMPVTGGSYNLDRLLSKLYPALDKYFGISAVTLDTPKDNKDEPTIQSQSDKLLFLKTLSGSDNVLIEAFTTLIKEKIPSIRVKENFYTYSFRVDDGTHALCWFAKNKDGILVLRYYPNPSKLEESNEKRMDSLTSAKKACSIVYSIYDCYYVDFDHRENPVKEPEPIEEPKKEENTEIYSHILEALKDKTIKADKTTAELCKDIARFVLNEVGNNAIAQKDFKNMEDFNRYKYARHYIAEFFGHHFSFRRLKEDDAKIFYQYYKASLLVNIIRRYETIYNKEIISDYFALINSLRNMIRYQNMDYSRAEGLLSTFSIVPTQLLDFELNKLP